MGEIEQGRVSLRLTREKFEQLEIYEAPPESIEIEAERAPRSERMIESFSNFLPRLPGATPAVETRIKKKHSAAWPRSAARCAYLGRARSPGYERDTAS